MDLLFESDKEEHLADTGHRLFVMIELDGNNGFVNISGAVTTKVVHNRFDHSNLSEHTLRSDVSEADLVSYHLRPFDHICKSNRIPKSRSNMQQQFQTITSTAITEPYHGRIDWDVAKRFLQILHQGGAMKKTKLAMKAGVNNGTCTKYIAWMLEVRWVRIIEVADGDEIALTEAGLQVCATIAFDNSV